MILLNSEFESLEEPVPTSHSNPADFELELLKTLSRGKQKVVAKKIETHISKGGSIQNKELLRQILEPSGMTVAHLLAHNGVKIDDPEILALKGEDRSDKNIAFGHNGCSVAYILAKKGFAFDDPLILRLGSEAGRSTVAHAMAEHGHDIKNRDCLTLRDDQGISVAHVMAKKGHKFEEEEILNLKSKFGFTVKAVQEQSHQK